MEPQPQRKYWERQFGTCKAPSPPNLRGYWIIFTPPHEFCLDWEKIKLLTARGLLGYMSSRSPDPMEFGAHAGSYTICVHTSPDEDEEIVNGKEFANMILEQFGFKGKIQEYRINARFQARWEEFTQGISQ